MAEQATFSTRIDAELKRDLEKICKEIGMSITTAFNIFARAVVREKKIPFEVGLGSNKDEAQLKIVEEEKIVLSPQEYKEFIKSCFSGAWEVSKEDLAFARKERTIREIK